MVLSKSGGRQTSPGPSWAVLAEPTPTSSPSPSMRSDVEMGDDEQEEESQLVDTPISTPGVKRKAIESPPIRGRAKVPKLHAPSITDHISLSSSSDREPGPSRTQASKLPNTTSRAPFMSQPARPSLPVSPRPRLNKGKEKVVESSRSSSDSLEGGATLTQRIVKIVEKEKPRWARKSVAGSSGRKVDWERALHLPRKRASEKPVGNWRLNACHAQGH
ncbi:hypothetical protein BV22DRAFT_180614 [Leucogyrophana mollusca]|uniref:Uncharacterized protein n=1 Tax=Leucogyrophana mollusca TaxID=85980 RepID=A0ACB8BTR2_9AGAM|nr:hypothetical protein BV22DRAFT_180614 [Leucogyrophana mollusca]